jgi:hypothetical protein
MDWWHALNKLSGMHDLPLSRIETTEAKGRKKRHVVEPSANEQKRLEVRSRKD